MATNAPTTDQSALHDTATGVRRVEAILGELHHYIPGATNRERAIACALHEAVEREVAHLLAEALAL